MGIIKDIKTQAKNNRTKIQSSEAATLEKIFNRMFYLDKNIEEETKFVKQVMTRGAESTERVGLHASALIKGEKDFCLRAQVLSLLYKQLQGEQVEVNLKRIFEQGNAIHEKWQRLFIRAGYSTYKDLDYTQFNDEYKISYTPDIICSIPEFYDGKMVGEIKSVNGIKKGFVLSEDKNTQDFKLEIYDFDPELIKVPIERAEGIKKAYAKVFDEKKMVPRPLDAKSSDCKRCSKCAMKDACWNIGMGKVRIK